MPVLDSPPTTDFQAPDLLQRDQGGTLTCPLYSGPDLVAPSSGTVSLYDPGNVVLVSAAAVTIVGDVARYHVAASVLTGKTLAMGYRVEWALVVAGVTWTFRNEIGIVRCVPAPAATHQDLVRQRTQSAVLLTGMSATSFQPWLDQAWRELTRWLLRQGNRPHLVVGPADLKDLHIQWTWRLFFEDLATSADVDGRYARVSKASAEDLLKLQNTAQFSYDASDDGQQDTSRRAARAPLFLSGTAGRGGSSILPRRGGLR